MTTTAVTEALKTAERTQRRRVKPAPEVRKPSAEGRIITVMAAEGGSGKTSLRLKRCHPARPVGQSGAGSHCRCRSAIRRRGLVLQVDPKHMLVNAAKEGEKLDTQFLETILATHSSGMRVLAAPLEPASRRSAHGDLHQDPRMLREMFDYVIVDTAPSLDERLLAILDKSDVVLFVVDMDLPSVKNAKLALETLRILNYPATR